MAPLLPFTVALPLEAALRTIEFANSSTPLRQIDWGALSRRAHNWWTGQKAGLVWPHLHGPRNLRMRRVQNHHLQAYARSRRGGQRGGITGGWKYILADLKKKENTLKHLAIGNLAIVRGRNMGCGTWRRHCRRLWLQR